MDLERLAANLRALRAALPAGVRVEPVVKADAYGHGAVPVARTLATAGADGLCVATYDEAVELRRAGARLPILVLYAMPPELAADAARRSISVTAGDAELLARTLVAIERAERGGGRRRPARLMLHLEVETGLGRAGLTGAEIPAAVAAIQAARGVELAGIWSHLGSPEDPLRSGAQTSAFDWLVEIVGRGLAGLPPRHVAASGGLLAGSAPAYESVRPGLAVYGIVPEDLPIAPEAAPAAAALRPVMSLHARPVRVTELSTGAGISYGATFVTERPSRIATLPVGYADGFSRTLSNRASALVRGRRVPLVGAVAMDAVMADVTDIPGSPVTLDDEFVLLGEQGAQRIDAAELARLRTTISWEILSVMARRLPRVYHAGAGPTGVRTLTDEHSLWRASSSGMGTSATSRSTRS